MEGGGGISRPCCENQQERDEKMANIREQKFVVEIETKFRDGCGNEVKPLTEGQVREALIVRLPHWESVSVRLVTPPSGKGAAV